MINRDRLDESDRDSQSAAGASADRQTGQLRSSATGLTTTTANFYAVLAAPKALAPAARDTSLLPQTARSFFAHMLFHMAASDHARRRLYTWTDQASPFAPPAITAPAWPRDTLEELRACKTQLDFQIWVMRWSDYVSGRIPAQIKASGLAQRRNAARQKKKRE
jgi:hypothetical protein